MGVNRLGSKIKRHNSLSHSCICLGIESDFDYVRRSETCPTDATSRVQVKKGFEPCRLRGFCNTKTLGAITYSFGPGTVWDRLMGFLSRSRRQKSARADSTDLR